MEEGRRNEDSEYFKGQNHAYARRLITTIAIVLTVLAVVLVTLSLLLGSRIDQIVNETLETNMKISGSELFLGPKINNTIIGWHGETDEPEKQLNLNPKNKY